MKRAGLGLFGINPAKSESRQEIKHSRRSDQITDRLVPFSASSIFFLRPRRHSYSGRRPDQSLGTEEAFVVDLKYEIGVVPSALLNMEMKALGVL